MPLHGKVGVVIVNSKGKPRNHAVVIEGMGFMLLVFEFGENKVANYVSNANREDMIEVLREKANVLEQKLDIPPVTNPNIQ